MAPIYVSSYAVDGVPVVEVAGDVDITNVVEFDGALVGAAANDFGAIVVSLEKVDYFDTRGMHALMDLIKRLDTSRQRLVVVSPTNLTARRILTIMGLDKRIDHRETLTEAIEAAKQHVADTRRPNGSHGATA